MFTLLSSVIVLKIVKIKEFVNFWKILLLFVKYVFFFFFLNKLLK